MAEAGKKAVILAVGDTPANPVSATLRPKFTVDGTGEGRLEIH